jgi:hypothetical protein
MGLHYSRDVLEKVDEPGSNGEAESSAGRTTRTRSWAILHLMTLPGRLHRQYIHAKPHET